MNLPADDRNFERLEDAEKASLRATDLTKQLLTFSKGGAPVKKSVLLKNMLKDASGFAVRGSNVSHEIFLQEDLWPVEVDEGQISQVIHNLVLNGCHAMPQGGKLTLRAKNHVRGTEDNLPLKKAKYIKVEIEDQGVGMPADYLKKIFDPYFSTKQEGSGLGRAVVYSIVKNHDGHIVVASEQGSGTTFTIYLPVSGKQISDEVVSEKKVVFGKGSHKASS